MLNQFEFEGKWTEIKSGIINIWGDISDQELESTGGNIQKVADIVQAHHLETQESINEKLKALMDSFDNETDKSLKLNDGISSYERRPEPFE